MILDFLFSLCGLSSLGISSFRQSGLFKVYSLLTTSPFPRTRQLAAEQLYLSVISDPEAFSLQPADLESIISILVETPWIESRTSWFDVCERLSILLRLEHHPN